jgi:transcriptional regulator with XRE-family HTH domain
VEATGREVAGVAQALTPVDRERLRALGANIRERRTAGDLTLEDLANEAGLSVTYLGQTERGQRNPSVLVLWRIAEALGITLDQLVAPDPGPRSRR